MIPSNHDPSRASYWAWEVKDLARRLLIQHPGMTIERCFSLAERFVNEQQARASVAAYRDQERDRERETLAPPAQHEDGPPNVPGRTLSITET